MLGARPLKEPRKCCPDLIGIIGKGDPLVGRLLLFEALSTQFTELKVRRDAEGCPVCGDHVDLVSTEFEDYEALCAAAG